MKPLQIKNIIIGDDIPKICVPIIGSTAQSIIQEAQNIHQTSADIVEWRIDFFEHYSNWIQIESIAKQLRQILKDTPLLFTFRTKQEGGQSDLSKQDYKILLTKVIESHLFELVDIELFFDPDIVKSLISLGQKQKILTIVSNHDFLSTPKKEELISRMKMMEMLGADIGKIAVMPKTKTDVIALLSATMEQCQQSTIPLVTMSMGQLGMISRICGSLTGSAITFGCIDHSSAPGQLKIEDLSRILQIFTNKNT